MDTYLVLFSFLRFCKITNKEQNFDYHCGKYWQKIKIILSIQKILLTKRQYKDQKDSRTIMADIPEKK